MLTQILSQKLRLSLRMFNLLLACWLASFSNLSFYQHLITLSSLSGFSLKAFIAVTVVLVSGFYFLVLQLLCWHRSAKAMACVLILVTGLSAYFVNQLGVNINTDQMQNVMQTDVHEALDLLSWPFLLWLCKTVVLPLAIIGLIELQPPPSLKSLWLDKILSSLLALSLVTLGLFAFYSQYAPIFRENRQLKAQISPLNIISSAWSYSQQQFKSQNLPLIPYGEDAHQRPQNPAHAAKIMLLIVGETARAQDFSLNGYAKPTNPELSQLDIINFTQASSCGTQTSVSVPCMFSGMPREDYDPELAAHREGLLDIAQRAGYQVTWIDNNSGCKGTCDRIKHYISIQDQPRYRAWCQQGECSDAALVVALNDYLTSLKHTVLKQNQLIVLHQIGSHGPAYYKRYPAEFAKFSPTCQTNNIQNCDHQSLVNTYDNTLLYTDHIIASSIRLLQQQQLPASVLYLSDHGESTGESGLYLHGTPYFMAPKEQTHIPMLAWFSASWPDQQQIRSCLSQQQHAAVGQDNLFATVLHLLAIDSRVINPQFDLLAQCKGQL
jgi:lipid A ethanolaminephosphotransferase